jgi:hypothetical protein
MAEQDKKNKAESETVSTNDAGSNDSNQRNGKEGSNSILGLVLPEYAYLIMLVLITVSYYIFSTTNQGFHMHDGIAHYINMKRVLIEPWVGLSIWQKPGYKFLVAPFSLLGENFLVWLHCLFIAGAAYWTGRAVKSAGYPGMRAFAMILVAYQPIVWQTAFRFHSENFIALLLAFFLWAWYEKKYSLAAVLISYAMVTRFELGLIAAGVGLILLYRKQWIPALLVGLFPLLLNILGFIHTTGDDTPGSSPFYFLTDMISAGSKFKYKQFGFWYNWKMLSPAVGVVIVGLAAIGLIPLGKGKEKFSEYISKHSILYLYFGAIFIGYCLFTAPWFTFLTLQSQDQAFTQFAPAIGMLAALGMIRFISGSRMQQMVALGAVGIFTMLIGVFNSVKYAHPNGFLHQQNGTSNIQAMQPTYDWTLPQGWTPVAEHSYVIVAFLLFAIMLSWFFIRYKPVIMMGLVSIVLMGHTFYIEEPKELTFEEQTCKQTAEWFKQNKVREGVQLYCSHNVFHYFSGHTVSDKSETSLLTWERIIAAPKGSIILWDTHYSFKNVPDHWRNVPLDSIQAHPDWFSPVTDKPFGDQRIFFMMPYRKLVDPVVKPKE